MRTYRKKKKVCARQEKGCQPPSNVSQPAGPGGRHCFRCPQGPTSALLPLPVAAPESHRYLAEPNSSRTGGEVRGPTLGNADVHMDSIITGIKPYLSQAMPAACSTCHTTDYSLRIPARKKIWLAHVVLAILKVRDPCIAVSWKPWLSDSWPWGIREIFWW